MPEFIRVDDLEFEVRRSSRRKTVSIILERDASLIIRAPIDSSRQMLEKVIEQKKLWLYSKLEKKYESIASLPIQKEYVTGEGFFYLGKSYRLLFFDPDPNQAYVPPLRLFRNRFLLRRDHRFNAREHFVNWYTIRGKGWLPERINDLAKVVDVSIRSFDILDIGYRWGNCSPKEMIIQFHWKLMMLPPEIIEYLIVHELSHFHVPSHSEDFWKLVELVLPDWLSRKQWLVDNETKFVL